MNTCLRDVMHHIYVIAALFVTNHIYLIATLFVMNHIYLIVVQFLKMLLLPHISNVHVQFL